MRLSCRGKTAALLDAGYGRNPANARPSQAFPGNAADVEVAAGRFPLCRVCRQTGGSTRADRHAAASAPAAPVEITGPWLVRFPPNLGAPPSRTFAKLVSWTSVPEDGVKYFSGTATYFKEFEAPGGCAGSWPACHSGSWTTPQRRRRDSQRPASGHPLEASVRG